MQNLNAYQQLTREMQYVVRTAVANAVNDVNMYVEQELEAEEASELTHQDYMDEIESTAVVEMINQIDPMSEVGISDFLHEAITAYIADQVRIRAFIRGNEAPF